MIPVVVAGVGAPLAVLVLAALGALAERAALQTVDILVDGVGVVIVAERPHEGP